MVSTQDKGEWRAFHTASSIPFVLNDWLAQFSLLSHKKLSELFNHFCIFSCKLTLSPIVDHYLDKRKARFCKKAPLLSDFLIFLKVFQSLHYHFIENLSITSRFTLSTNNFLQKTEQIQCKQ